MSRSVLHRRADVERYAAVLSEQRTMPVIPNHQSIEAVARSAERPATAASSHRFDAAFGGGGGRWGGHAGSNGSGSRRGSGRGTSRAGAGSVIGSVTSGAKESYMA
jgi:hypothetical protein